MPKLGIKEHKIVKISKKRGLFSVARIWVKSQVGENEGRSLVKGLEKTFYETFYWRKDETNQNHQNVSNW